MQKVGDVLKAHLFLVDEVFAVAASVQPSGNHHFVEFDRKNMVRVVKIKLDLAKAQTFSGGSPHKYDVLHIFASQLFCAFFAQNPPYGVGNVAFAGTVRPDDCRHIVLERNCGFVGKRLETVKNDLF